MPASRSYLVLKQALLILTCTSTKEKRGLTLHDVARHVNIHMSH